jgi:hypothetical protein
LIYILCTSFHPCNKTYLIMVYNLLNVLLDFVTVFYWGFLHLCSSGIFAYSFSFLLCIFTWFRC